MHTAFTALIVAVVASTFNLATHTLSIVEGNILLDVEQSGEAWYVYPQTNERYYLGRPDDAYDIMRELSLGITDADLANIPIAGSNESGNQTLRNRLSGYILLQVEQHGEAWYVYPDTRERYYLGRPSDAFAIMTNLGLGIRSQDLSHIPIASSSLEPTPGTKSSYRAITITTAAGSFPVRVVTLQRDHFRMITDTAVDEDCKRDCAAQSLQTYISEHQAFAGMHGSYFCPPDYNTCANQINTFIPPVYKTDEDLMINEDGLRSFHRPILAQTADGQLLYFHRAQDFGDSVQEFESRTGLTLTAAIGNWPSLVENGAIVVDQEPSEENFMLKGRRGGIGWNDSEVILVVADNATVPDLATIFDALDVDFALNMDGGGSAALYYDGAYRAGPGRDLPNAILFRANP